MPAGFVDIPLTTKATWQLDQVNAALLYEVWQSAGFTSATIQVWYRPQGQVLATVADASFYDRASAQRALAQYWQLLSTGGPAFPGSFSVPGGIQLLALRRATSSGETGEILSAQRGKDILLTVLTGSPLDGSVTAAIAGDMKGATG